MPYWNLKGIWVINLLFSKTLKSVVILKLNSMSPYNHEMTGGDIFFCFGHLMILSSRPHAMAQHIRSDEQTVLT